MSAILTTIRWLSIFTGALSLFYLGNAWFEFGLGEVFTRIYAWYAGILHPVVELLKPMALWLMGLLGWSLPVWWKDGVVLYVAVGGATARGGMSYKDARWEAYRQGYPGVADSHTTRRNWLIPVRLVVWPVFWMIGLWSALAMARKYQRDRGPGEPGFWSDFITLVRLGYAGNSVAEFIKILIAALIFAALNAGLG